MTYQPRDRPTPDRDEVPHELEPHPSNRELHAAGVGSRAAGSDKHVYVRLPDWTDAELEQLPLLEPGTHLEQGSVYFDLNDPERGAFTATGSEEVDAGDRYVPKRLTHHDL
jgi:hypothetical protein